MADRTAQEDALGVGAPMLPGFRGQGRDFTGREERQLVGRGYLVGFFALVAVLVPRVYPFETMGSFGTVASLAIFFALLGSIVFAGLSFIAVAQRAAEAENEEGL